MGKRGVGKHLKRLNAPKHWMLDKLGGVFAPKSSAGPHKLRESIPLVLILRNRLNYALNGNEVKKILMQRLVKVDNRVRTDPTYPAGFMDVISIERTKENFRLLYDPKGRFLVHRISALEAKYKLLKVLSRSVGPAGVPYLTTNDGRTIRYPNPDIQVHDTIKFELETSTISDFLKFEVGQQCMITGGHNIGRVGVITSRERHPGSNDIVHVKDSKGHAFATRIGYVFVIAKGTNAYVSLPREKGLRMTITEERDLRLQRKK